MKFLHLCAHIFLGISCTHFAASNPLTLPTPEKPAAPAEAKKPRIKRPPSIIFNVDQTVTFQLLAPNAKRASCLIHKQPDGRREMERGEDGIWRVTFGPLEPGTYSYEFEIDGFWTVDPANSQAISGHESMRYSLLEISGEGTAHYEFQQVSHGAIRTCFFRSEILGGMLRRYVVYTPPGYDTAHTTSYPVLFLLHGSGGNDRTLVDFIRIQWLCDNLIAAGKIQPMIIVMPNGSHSDSIEPFPRTTVLPADLPEDKITFGNYDKNNRLMVDSYVSEILPIIQNDFRTKSGREHLAISGYSMGGDQSIHAGLVFPAVFGHVIPMAPGARMPEKVYSTALYRKILADGYATKNPPQWHIISGEKDDYIENVKGVFLPLLNEAGVHCPLTLTTGVHDYLTARMMLTEHVLPSLFKSSEK